MIPPLSHPGGTLGCVSLNDKVRSAVLVEEPAEKESVSGAVFLPPPRSSFVCGLAGALASNPVDVVRTRLMNQRGGALYQGTLDCLLQVRRVCLGRLSHLHQQRRF